MVEGWKGRQGEEEEMGEYHTLTSRFEEGGQAHAEDVGARGVGGGVRHGETSKLMRVVMKLEEGRERTRAAMAFLEERLHMLQLVVRRERSRCEMRGSRGGE